ncbi:MAG: PD-(D/E)XK nuclease family protein [Halioglobus sp.]
MVHRLYDISDLQPFIDRGCLLLTPNARLARRVKMEWDRSHSDAGAKVWEPLSVYPLERWLLQQWQAAVLSGELPALLPLSRAQELQLWQQVILEQADEDASLINPDGAAELASEARELLVRWEISLDPQGAGRGLRSQFALEGDCQRFLRWQDDFERALQQGGLCTTADCLRTLCHATASAAKPELVLLEVGELAPLLETCLHAQGSSVERFEAGKAECDICVHPFIDSRAELAGVAAWAAAQQRRSPEESVAIVFNGSASERAALEYELRREFDCLGEHYASLPVNFSAGMPLSEVPVIRTALTLLELVELPISVGEVVRLFNSQFLALADAESAAAQTFLRKLYDGGSERVDAGALRSFAGKAEAGSKLQFGDCLLAVSRLRKTREKRLPSSWIPLFNSILDIWGWPGEGGLDSLEFQQVQRWYETLDEFGSLDLVCGPLSFQAALQLLRGASARKVSHPETADSAVQVLGPLEAAGLRFDQLWMVGMQRSAWPAAPRPNPLIPLSLQAQCGMPHATPEREWQYAKSLFDQLVRGSAVLHASYSSQVDGVSEGVSALLDGIQPTATVEITAVPPDWAARQASGGLEQLQDQRAPALTDDELQHTGGGAALLEAQSQCAFQSFARNRLAVVPLGEFGAGLSASERGTLVHEALHHLWRQITGHAALLALQQMAVDSLVKESTKKALLELPDFRRIAVGHACLELEAQRLRSLLLEWLAVERARGEFRVLALEQSVEVTLSQLRLKLRVDRMDELPDGGKVVIDYKTGASSTTDWLGDRPRKPQLLLYGLAEDELPAAISFARVRPGDCAYVGLGCAESIPGVRSDIQRVIKDRMDVADWESLNARWRQTLQQLAQAFIEGNAAVLPLSKSCTYCGLQPLCRINVQDAGDTLAEQVT